VVVAAAAYGLLAGLAQISGGLHAVAFHGVVQGLVAAAVGLGIVCLAWLLSTRRRAFGT
jgi:hypothetical protein